MSKGNPVKGARRFSNVIQLPRKAVEKFNNLGRNTKLASSLAAILLLVGVWSIAFHQHNTTPTESARQEDIVEIENAPAMDATVSYREGVIEQRNELGEWSDAEKELSLKQGMGLRTIGAASRAVINLEDGSVIRLDASTEIVVSTLTESRVVIEQKSGNVYNRVVPSEARTYIVKTDNAQFQAVGTAFRTIANGDEEAVEVYQNTVRETRNNISANEGDKLTAKNKNNPEKDGKVERIDIEVLKKDTFITWCRELDQKDDAFKNALGYLSDFDGPTIDITEPAAGSSIEVPNEKSEGTIIIKGKTEKGSKLTIQSKSLAGSSPVDVVVKDDGSFESSELKAPVGNSVFELIATYRIGNKTTKNISYFFKAESIVQKQGIALSKSQTGDMLKFEWALIGMSTPDGVKLVGGVDENPEYPAAFIEYVPSGKSKSIDKSSYTVGETYYFRVCRYNPDSDSCDVYSNQVAITIE
ncbi:FecR domain-containing protein [Candidatus Saccharibacteria bacterium]|nr:FecR domain-containing protein [Candidatus Saccharibacteria bacterium]